MQGDSALLSVGVVVAGVGEELPSSTLLLIDTMEGEDEDEVGARLLAATVEEEEWTGMTNASDRDAANRRTRATRRRKRGLGVVRVAARRAMVLLCRVMVGGEEARVGWGRRSEPCVVCAWWGAGKEMRRA